MTRKIVSTSLLAITALVAVATASGCASSTYGPQVVARGELTARYDGGFELSAGGRRVAKGITYRGLEPYVRCVPEAKRHAEQAATSGRAAIALSVFGGVLGAGGLIGLIGLVDQDNWKQWIGGGFGAAAVGLTFSILSWRYKNHANGHAIDAMNFYNDSVGSLGATCDELVYPAPVGPAPAGPFSAPPAPSLTPPPDANLQPTAQPPS